MNRTVIVGDLQYPGQIDLSDVVEDIETLNADAVILLGDYGDCGLPDKYTVFAGAAEAFRDLSAPNFVPLLGNHDVQHEIMRLAEPGSAAQHLKKTFGVDEEHRVLEFPDFRIFSIGCECPPERNAYGDNECYLSPETMEFLYEKLAERPDVPTIMVTHAPIAGCGLMIVPGVHVRASNAYMNQDHDYWEFANLLEKNPQIVMWFCGHYHMGHFHEGSAACYKNTAFFITGAPTMASRDGQKHSRVIDFDGETFILRTYDHDIHRLLEDVDYRVSVGGPCRIPEKAPYVGGGNVVGDYICQGENGHIFVQTDTGFLWEIDVEYCACIGTIHFSQKYALDGFYLDGDMLWRICTDVQFGHHLDDLRRFMRYPDYDRCRFVTKPYDGNSHDGGRIYRNPDGSFTLADGRQITLYCDQEGLLRMVFGKGVGS